MTIMDIFTKAVAVDDAAGAVLIDCVVYDFMADLVEINKTEINQVYSMWALDRIQDAKKTLAKSYVSNVSKGSYPSDDMHLAANWLAGIESFIVTAARGDVSKSRDSYIQSALQQRQRRDTLGRWTRGVNQSMTREISPTDDNLAPQLKKFTNRDTHTWTGGMTPDKAKVTQGNYEAAMVVALEFKEDIGRLKADALFMVMGPDGGIRTLRTKMDDIKDTGTDIKGLRADDMILGVEISPAAGASVQESARIAEFNLLGGAGGSALAQLANTNSALRENLKQSLKLPKASENKSNLSRLFSILASGGAVLAGISGPSKIGEMASLVGTMGPQAEEVFGPYVKRSAYRYRGTETTPLPELRDPQAITSNKQIDATQKTFPMSSGKSLEMHVRADAASSILAETIPQDPIIARLSERAGQILPSQGVIYDLNGKLVSQSVGFADDHYLPFDLSNLGRLRGGQYVRTRQQGGLTGEDIYTAVMTGARQVQVVSGSGVFSLEMAPDFRGARAMSDKARGMYDRYLKILDAIDESGLYLQDISAKEKHDIRSKVRDRFGESTDKETVEVAIKAEIERARRRDESINADDEEAAAVSALEEAGGIRREGESALEASARLSSMQRRIYHDAYEDNIEDARSRKTNQLRLNGEGYSVALQTLMQQFPYFIADAKYREVKELPTDKTQNLPKTRRYVEDRGYTMPGSLRPKNVKTGFYNPGNIEPGAKDRRDISDGEKSSERTVESSGPSSVNKPESEQSGQSQEKAPAIGVQRIVVDQERMTNKLLKDVSESIALAGTDLPKSATVGGEASLPFGSMKTPEQRVIWLLSQVMATNAVDAMTGPFNAQAAEAMSDEKVTEKALRKMLNNEGGDDWFENGNKFSGQNTLVGAARWLAERGRDLSEAAAMKQGLVKTPDTKEDIINHRGLMPLQMPEIEDISTSDEFKNFISLENNKEIFALANALAYEGKDLRTLSEISTKAVEALDAIVKINEGRDAALEYLNLHPTEDTSNLQVTQFISPEEWQEADGSTSMPSIADLLHYNKDGKDSFNLQRAWSLAVTGRIIETSEGGDVYPKVESRLLEPVGKSTRRTMYGPTGHPIDLVKQAKESKEKAQRYKEWKKSATKNRPVEVVMFAQE